MKNMRLKSKKEQKIIFQLLIIAFIIRIIFVFYIPLKDWDETVYANLAYEISKNPLYYSLNNSDWSDYIPSGGKYGWPKIGFRPPLFPYMLSFFYILNLDFLISLFSPLIGAISVYFVYVLGKKLFNQRVALYSSILFLLLPFHVIYSAKIMPDVLLTFLTLLTFLSFWKGYEENNEKYKILFGVLLALCTLTKYTAFFVMPVFLLYLLLKRKSISFLIDKYFWYSILAFFVTLAPWFVYGIFEYENMFSPFIHGIIASKYWGGHKSWYFFFLYWFRLFSFTGIIFFVSLIFLYKKVLSDKKLFILFIWSIIFLAIASYLPHKEERYILPIFPPIALVSAYFLDNIKKYKKKIMLFVIFVSLFSLSFELNLNIYYTQSKICFLRTLYFLKNVNENSLIITDESPIVYYYTKLKTHFYPNPWNFEIIKEWIKKDYKSREIYVIFGDYLVKSDEEKNKIKEDLENNSEIVWSCSEGKSYSVVYKINKNA
jgi:4-amino-4-deoxy-L-arabinose transferase-like glycosyltransferase